MSPRWPSFCCILSLPLLLSKRPRHPRESEERRNDAEFAYLPDEQTCTCLRRNHIPSSALNALFAADDQWAASGREGAAMKRCTQCHGKLGLGVPASVICGMATGGFMYAIVRPIARPFMSWSGATTTITRTRPLSLARDSPQS
jgi:hypothetical protein